MQKILCFFGFHDYSAVSRFQRLSGEMIYWRSCSHCGRLNPEDYGWRIQHRELSEYLLRKFTPKDIYNIWHK